jgi:AcrR family transcriptional regulator
MNGKSSPRGTEKGGNQRFREILEAAARLICAQGYQGTSIQEIAAACNLTKAGLYHHIQSKEHLLLEIMNYGMDLFEEQVLLKVVGIADPLERLRECMALNVRLVSTGSSREVNIILHEHATLTGEAQAQINARKKRYVRFLESAFEEAMAKGMIRPVDPKVAAFSFLGMVLWVYQWFREDGSRTVDDVVEGMTDLLFTGLAPIKKKKKLAPSKGAVVVELPRKGGQR